VVIGGSIGYIFLYLQDAVAGLEMGHGRKLVWFGNFDYLSRSVVDSSTFMIRSPSRSSFNPLPCFVSCCSSILNTTSPFCYYAKQRRCTLYSTPAGTMTVTKCSPPRGAKKDARCIIAWSILCSDLQERVTSTMVCVHR